MKNDNVVEDIYKEILQKRNKCKIDIDNYETEMEIEKRNLEYRSSIEDDSKIFSPRSNGNIIEDSNDINSIIEKYEKLIEAKKKEYDHYEGYCKRLAHHLKLNENDETLKSLKESDKDFTYSISLNYDVNEIKNKLSMVKNMTEISIKIYDNDRERTRQELIRIDKALEDLINEL